MGLAVCERLAFCETEALSSGVDSGITLSDPLSLGAAAPSSHRGLPPDYPIHDVASLIGPRYVFAGWTQTAGHAFVLKVVTCFTSVTTIAV